MTFGSCGGLPINQCLFYSFRDYSTIWLGVICISIFLIYYFAKYRRQKHSVEPATFVDEFDKSGDIKPYEISDEQEGAAFVQFERTNGDVENKRIGGPFTFILANDTIERHHLNPRKSHRCLDPPELFEDFKPDLKQLNITAAYTEQQIRGLRTGTYAFGGKAKHIRTFILIFALACMIGLGLSAAGVHH